MDRTTEESEPDTKQTAPVWLSRLIRCVVFLFPISVASFGWGSILFILILLPALYYGRSWEKLSTWERRLMFGYMIVFVAMSLSLLNAEEFYEGVQALERYLRFAMIVPIYLMFRRYRFSMGREFAAGAVLACVVMGMQAFYQVEWQGLSIAKGHYHKIVFGDLAVWWAATAALLAVIVVKNWKGRLGITLAIFCAVYASLLSQTRGAWLFIPIIPAILLWAQWGCLRSGRGWIVAGVIALVVAGSATAWQSERFKYPINRGIHELETFTQNPEAPTSLGIRLNLWRNSLLLLKETPLLGSGAGDFQADMKRMVADGRSWSPSPALYKHAHNIYFDTLAKGGVLGFVATFTAILLLPLIAFGQALRRATEPWNRFYAVGGVMLIAAFATFGMSEGLWSRNPFVNTYVISLVVFLAGTVNSCRQSQEEDSQNPD